jgi:hypothetical protein
MMQVWIEDENGVRLGDGPIITATGWQQTALLNAAGSFRFDMPAADPRAALVCQYRWARAWHYAAGGWRQVGYGRIGNLSTNVSPDGEAVMTVTGGDELSQLADRMCIALSLANEVQRHPAWVGHDAAQPMYGTYDYGIGDTSTADTMATDVIWVGANRCFHKISVVVDTPHANTSVLTATYYSGTYQEWRAVEITDGTSAGGDVAFVQSGDITFEPPTDWAIEPGDVNFILRLSSSGAITSVKLADITVWHWEPSSTALQDILAYAPPGWSLDTANGYDQTEVRRLGAEMLNGGMVRNSYTGNFEEFVGTVDDGTTDAFQGWTTDDTDDGSGRSVLAVTPGRDSGHAVKITSDSGAYYPYIYRDVTVTPGMQYTLSYWTKGDGGDGQIMCVVSWPTGSKDFITFDTMQTATAWGQFTHVIDIPSGVTTIRLAFYLHYPTASPATAYMDDVSLRPGGGQPVYIQLRDESVLEALRQVAGATSENFILSPAGRKVLWLGPDGRSSGMRALAAAAPDAGNAPNTLYLTGLTESADSSLLVSRVYPYGGGMGSERVTLANVTQPTPSGYTLDKTENYLERDQAAAVMGQIESVQSWADIIPLANDKTQREHAANALMWRAWQYLETHSATDTSRVYGDTPRSYSAQVVGGDRLVLPGYTLRLQYRQWRAGQKVIDIDRNVWITGVTYYVNNDNLRLIGLQMSTVPRIAENDSTLIARSLIRLRDITSRNTATGY